MLIVGWGVGVLFCGDMLMLDFLKLLVYLCHFEILAFFLSSVSFFNRLLCIFYPLILLPSVFSSFCFLPFFRIFSPVSFTLLYSSSLSSSPIILLIFRLSLLRLLLLPSLSHFSLIYPSLLYLHFPPFIFVIFRGRDVPPRQKPDHAIRLSAN